MRKLLSTLALAIVPVATALTAAPASAGDFGLGIILGAPSGVSAKLRTGQRQSFDAAAAWHLGKYDAFHLHLDHLWQSRAFNIESQAVDVHYGVGGRLRLVDATDDATLGVRVPVGLTAALNRSPVEVFFELALVMDIVPATDADFDAGIGVRYFF